MGERGSAAGWGAINPLRLVAAEEPVAQPPLYEPILRTRPWLLSRGPPSNPSLLDAGRGVLPYLGKAGSLPSPVSSLSVYRLGTLGVTR